MAPRTIDHDAVRALHQQGFGYVEIAARIGASKTGVRQVIEKRVYYAPIAPGLALGWTDERIEALKAHFVKGLSASESARLLGGVSRNAVISKRSRIGLKAGPERIAASCKTANANKPRRAPPVAQNTGQNNGLNMGVRKFKPVTNAPVNFQIRAYIEPQFAPIQPSGPPIDVSHAKPEYSRRECNWPIGDGEAMLFCCNPVHPGSNLCPGHRQIGRQPAKDKRPERGARHLSRVDGIDLQRVDERIVPLDRLFG